ncbi:unnamed protein product [Didymodactylos carnosus]|uniref:Uncharacterized protein n=1 Tax=Didymodactylos carnosus TaxID=1234261 RepID=A0A814AVD1_9BILA|nr:unnamed protein product [Didymodactylos carnosus]CAF3700018.1 unnamed protein product [Didymodactylos carnosus]
MSFLSIYSNQNDACLLLNRCFEQFAMLSISKQFNSIKSVYLTLVDVRLAETEFQTHVFYKVHEKLPEHKKYINFLQNTKRDLQVYIDDIPIIYHYTDFAMQLQNPKNNSKIFSSLLLNRLLNSIDLLNITTLIYDLSRFYILLHQTFTQLISIQTFEIITLAEFLTIGKKQFRQNENFYDNIVQKGIEAINRYHTFTNGYIQPGRCNLTQQFQSITIDTLLTYLMTTQNSDESDIIMRIIIVLVNYHNDLLNILETDIDEI